MLHIVEVCCCAGVAKVQGTNEHCNKFRTGYALHWCEVAVLKTLHDAFCSQGADSFLSPYNLTQILERYCRWSRRHCWRRRCRRSRACCWCRCCSRCYCSTWNGCRSLHVIRNAAFDFGCNGAAFECVYDVIIEYIQIDRTRYRIAGFSQYTVVVSTGSHEVVNYCGVALRHADWRAVSFSQAGNPLINRQIHIGCIFQTGNLQGLRIQRSVSFHSPLLLQQGFDLLTGKRQLHQCIAERLDFGQITKSYIAFRKIGTDAARIHKGEISSRDPVAEIGCAHSIGNQVTQGSLIVVSICTGDCAVSSTNWQRQLRMQSQVLVHQSYSFRVRCYTLLESSRYFCRLRFNITSGVVDNQCNIFKCRTVRVSLNNQLAVHSIVRITVIISGHDNINW
ncbi:hypothetical protein D3C75_600450 [compost metagenome]